MSETIIGMRDFNRRLDALTEHQRTMAQWQTRTTQEAKHRWARQSKKTNLTINTIRAGYLSDKEALVNAGGNAVFVELGTKPHIIRPRNKAVLAWPAAGVKTTLTGRAARSGKGSSFNRRTGSFAPGTFIYAMEVHHPGTKPKPFLKPAAVDVLRRMNLKGVYVNLWNGAA